MPTSYAILMESFPDDVDAALAKSKAAHSSMARTVPGLEFIVRDLERWPTGDVITVAFMGGSTDMHAAIADACQPISNSCGIELDFGRNIETGRFRSWTTKDTTYAADIRVSFDMDGYWSLVGTDSINRDLTDASMDVGGAPHQRSLNLGGYDQRLPTGWRRTVLHEFLHAVAYVRHRDQNPGGCDAAVSGDTLSPGEIRQLQLLYPDEGNQSRRRALDAREACVHLAGVTRSRQAGSGGHDNGGLAHVLQRLGSQPAET